MAKILLVGVGNVGSHILEFAARDESDFEWIIGDVNEERARLYLTMQRLVLHTMESIQLFDQCTSIFLTSEGQLL